MLPFPGGIEDPSNGSVVLSVGAAVLYLLLVDTRPSLLRAMVKTLAVGLLAVLAVIQQLPLLLVLALVLSALGDWFLAFDGERPFVAGLASFLAAHIAFVALFWSVSDGSWLVADDPSRMITAAVMAVFALAMLVLLMRQVGPELRLPIVAYILAILAMGVAALNLSIPYVIFGAVTFMASDAILAAERFLVPAISPHRAWMRYAVWVLYYVAQALIVAGFLLRG